MTPRTRDTWLLIAGLPGVVALFLPLTRSLEFSAVEHYWAQLSDSSRWLQLSLHEFWGLDWAVALPLLVSLLQARQLLTVPAVARSWCWTLLVPTLFLQLAMGAFTLSRLCDINWSLPRGWLELEPEDLKYLLPMLVLTAANISLLYRNRRQRWPLAPMTEVFMLGTYIALMSFWLPFFFLLDRPLAAPRLMLWTCLAYLVTIVVRWRNVQLNRAASDATVSRAVR